MHEAQKSIYFQLLCLVLVLAMGVGGGGAGTSQLARGLMGEPQVAHVNRGHRSFQIFPKVNPEPSNN